MRKIDKKTENFQKIVAIYVTLQYYRYIRNVKICLTSKRGVLKSGFSVINWSDSMYRTRNVWYCQR